MCKGGLSQNGMYISFISMWLCLINWRGLELICVGLQNVAEDKILTFPFKWKYLINLYIPSELLRGNGNENVKVPLVNLCRINHSLEFHHKYDLVPARNSLFRQSMQPAGFISMKGSSIKSYGMCVCFDHRRGGGGVHLKKL